MNNETTTRSKIPNYTTALMVGERIELHGCTCAKFRNILMPYGSPTLDQWEKLHGLGMVVLDAKAWRFTPDSLADAKRTILHAIDNTTIYAVRLKQYAYEVTEARVYSLPLANHSDILNRKARNCVMLFLTPVEAQSWAQAQGAKNVIFETLNALS